MHQNLAVILRQFCYGKISFIILIPARITFLTEKILRTTFPPKQIRSIFTESQNLTEKKSFWKSIRVNTFGLIKFQTGLIPAFGRSAPTSGPKAYPMSYPLATLFKKWAISGLFFVYLRLFKQTLPFLQQINVKNVHPVFGAEIRTHNLRNMSLLP